MEIYDWDNSLYRNLKSKRNSKKRQKKDLEKYLTSLRKRREAIRIEQRNLGFEELNPPIQRGWKRTFVLHDSVKYSNQDDFFQNLLDKINTECISNRKDFTKKKKRRGKKIRVETQQFLQVLSEYRFKKLIQTEKEKSYFEQFLVYSKSKTFLHKEYHFREPWRFKLRIVPNWIRFAKIIDPLLLQEDAEIDAYLLSNNLEAKMYKLKDGYYSYKDRWNPTANAKYTYLLKQNSYLKYLDEFIREKQNEQI